MRRMSEQPPVSPGPPPEDPQQPPQSPSQPPPNPYQPYGGAPGYSATGVPQWAPDHPDSTTVLILGILGIAVCQVIAPFAWVKGGRVKREIDESGGKYGGRSQVQLGYVLGIVGSALLALYVVGFLFYILVVVIAFSAGT
jgi:hypothetical protein